MSLHLLNNTEIDSNHASKINPQYKTEISGDNYISVCIKAIEKLIQLMQEAQEACDKLNSYKDAKIQGKIVTSALISDSYTSFTSLVTKIKEIIMAFIQDCSSALESIDTTEEESSLHDLKFLLEQLQMLLTGLRAFNLSKDIKYSKISLAILENLLKIFKNCLENPQ